MPPVRPEPDGRWQEQQDRAINQLEKQIGGEVPSVLGARAEQILQRTAELDRRVRVLIGAAITISTGLFLTAITIAIRIH